MGCGVVHWWEMTGRVQKRLSGREVQELKKTCNSYAIFNHRTLYWSKTCSYTKTSICFNENSLFFKAAFKCLSILYEKDRKNLELKNLFVMTVHEYTQVPGDILYAFIAEDQLKITVCKDCGIPMTDVRCRMSRWCSPCNAVGY